MLKLVILLLLLTQIIFAAFIPAGIGVILDALHLTNERGHEIHDKLPTVSQGETPEEQLPKC